MDLVAKIAAEQQRLTPNFRTGDLVRVHVRIREGEKERVQMFEGIVIRMRRGGVNASFTVRKVSYGVGVERLFPMHAPSVEKVDTVAHNKVRRSRLFYLRDLRGKAARLKERDSRAERARAGIKGVRPNVSIPRTGSEQSADGAAQS